MDGNNQLDLDLDSEHNDDGLESHLLSGSEDRADCRRIFVVPNSFRTSLKLENTNLLHSSPPVEFLKLFITGDFVPKMAEQTNFYAVQRCAPRSFKPVFDRVSTSTQTVGEGQRQFLDFPYVKLTLAVDSVLLSSMQKFITFI